MLNNNELSSYNHLSLNNKNELNISLHSVIGIEDERIWNIISMMRKMLIWLRRVTYFRLHLWLLMNSVQLFIGTFFSFMPLLLTLLHLSFYLSARSPSPSLQLNTYLALITRILSLNSLLGYRFCYIFDLNKYRGNLSDNDFQLIIMFGDWVRNLCTQEWKFLKSDNTQFFG